MFGYPFQMYPHLSEQEQSLKKQNFSSKTLDDNLQKIEQCYSFIWQYMTGKVRPTSYSISCPHQTQFISQYRKLPINQTLKLNKTNDRVRSMHTESLIRHKTVQLPVAFVDIYGDKEMLICLEKGVYQPQDWLIMHFPRYDLGSYFYIKLQPKIIQLDFKPKRNPETQDIFEVWQQQQKQTPKPGTFESIKKTIKKYASNKFINYFNISNSGDIVMNIKHRKLIYLRYSAGEVATWALTNLISNCDEDLLYYVWKLLN